jgi:nitroreductase/NAD-dependent dihydropyrimidine dehydrogenase PreA subunit
MHTLSAIAPQKLREKYPRIGIAAPRLCYEHNMNHVVVDPSRCLHDGICVANCPMSLLDLEETPAGRLPTSDKGERCVACGHCVSVCRAGALALTSLSRADLRDIRPEHAITPEQAEQLLQSRRSIRRYREKAVPRDLIERALDSARFAPSGLNLQPVAWTVIDGREKVHALASAVRDFAADLLAKKHPMAERLDFARFVGEWDKGQDTILRDAPAVVLAHTLAADPMGPGAATIAMTYFQLAAIALGLGTCWAGYLQIALAMSAAVAKLAGIPEGRQSHGASMVGYAKHGYVAIPPRKPLQVSWV